MFDDGIGINNQNSFDDSVVNNIDDLSTAELVKNSDSSKKFDVILDPNIAISSNPKSSNQIDKNIENQILYWVEFLAGKISPINQITIRKDQDQYRFVVDFEDATLFSDNSFAVLKATQHIIRALLHKSNPLDRTHFCIDINNEQRKKRENFIKQHILSLAQDQLVVRGKTIIVINLTSYERFLIHQLFIDTKNIETSSVGKEENRKLMIFPTSDSNLAGLEDSFIVDINREFKKLIETESLEVQKTSSE
jgi:predicted RNA-binding protein Jag